MGTNAISRRLLLEEKGSRVYLCTTATPQMGARRGQFGYQRPRSSC